MDKLSTGAFSGANKVLRLDIIGCDIVEIETEALVNMTSDGTVMSFVHISLNTINVVRAQAFRGLQTFGQFYFNDNSVQCAEHTALENIQSKEVITDDNVIRRWRDKCVVSGADRPVMWFTHWLPLTCITLIVSFHLIKCRFIFIFLFIKIWIFLRNSWVNTFHVII